MKTLNDLIEELLKLQKEGKGNYSVCDGYLCLEIKVSVYDDVKEILF